MRIRFLRPMVARWLAVGLLAPLLLTSGAQASDGGSVLAAAATATPAAAQSGLALLPPPDLLPSPAPQPVSTLPPLPLPMPSPSPAPVIVPAQPAAPQAQPQPQRLLRWAYMVGSSIPPEVQQHPQDFDYLAPAWFHLDDNGDIYGNDSPEVTQFAKAHGIKIVPIVDNGEFDPDVAHDILSDGSLQTHTLDSLQWLVNNFGYDGINIDFENLYTSDRDGFDAFMSNVYARIHKENGKLVTIALPSKTEETDDGFSGAFDYPGLAPHLDLAVVMTYDQHYAGGPAGPVASLDWVNQVITYATKYIPANKLLLGLPFYGYDWNLTWGGWAAPMSYDDIVSTVFAHGPGIQMDPTSKTPMYTYTDPDGSTHQIWFEDSTSLDYKVQLAASRGLAGWGAWRLGQEDTNFWNTNLSGK